MGLKKLINAAAPPDKWRLPVLMTVAVLLGLGLVIMHIANATSYLSDDPRACINCHVMTAQYSSWSKSSHARVATCNDCHVPHNNVFSTYLFKAQDGLRHATIFTARAEPEVIRIKEAGINVVQENCIRCHDHQVHRTSIRNEVTLDMREEGNGRFCWDCHRETPHGRVSSLSSFPSARVPQLSPVLPEWLEKYTKSENTNK